MLLDMREAEQLEALLWVTAILWQEAFGIDAPGLGRWLMRVVQALERGETVQRRGGWVRKGNNGFKRTQR